MKKQIDVDETFDDAIQLEVNNYGLKPTDAGNKDKWSCRSNHSRSEQRRLTASTEADCRSDKNQTQISHHKNPR